MNTRKLYQYFYTCYKFYFHISNRSQFKQDISGGVEDGLLQSKLCTAFVESFYTVVGSNKGMPKFCQNDKIREIFPYLYSSLISEIF